MLTSYLMFFLFNFALSGFFTVNVYIVYVIIAVIIISNCIKCYKRLNKHASALECNLVSLLFHINKYMNILYRMDCHS